MQAATKVSHQSEAVEVPALLKPIRTALLHALFLSNEASNAHERAQADSLFLKNIAMARVLGFRASFHVVLNHFGQKSIEVHFSADPTIWEETR